MEDTTVSMADRIAASKIESLIDRGALANLESLGGHAFVSGLVSQFSDDAAELLSSLRAAVAEEDVQRFRDAAHALRGSAANLGAARVFEACLALRAITPSQLALEGDAQVSRLVSDVNHAIDLLKAHVAAHRDNAVMCRKAQPSRHQGIRVSRFPPAANGRGLLLSGGRQGCPAAQTPDLRRLQVTHAAEVSL